MMIWFLTIYLSGVPIHEDNFPYKSLKDCKAEAWRLVAWYQQDHIKAEFTCEETVVSGPIEGIPPQTQSAEPDHR